MGLSWIPANLVLFAVLTVVGFAIFDRRWRQMRTQPAFTRPACVSVALAVVVGVVFSAAGIAPMLWLGALPGNGMSFVHEVFAGLPVGADTALAAFGWALLHQGLPEELFFRGLLPLIIAHTLANGITFSAAMLAGSPMGS